VTAGELLKETRRLHGLTQAQLARRARTSQAAISRIERDVVSPSVSTLAALLDLMGEELQLDAEPIDSGHDRTLIQQNLEFTPEERIRRQAQWSNGARALRDAARRTTV
jgi:transcriptional regulator with XRE-family HTH domain